MDRECPSPVLPQIYIPVTPCLISLSTIAGMGAGSIEPLMVMGVNVAAISPVNFMFYLNFLLNNLLYTVNSLPFPFPESLITRHARWPTTTQDNNPVPAYKKMCRFVYVATKY